MEWKKLPNGDWQAIGKKGDFLIWKDGRYWRMRYWVKERNVSPTLLGFKSTWKEAKAFCEANRRWEKGA